MTLPPSHPEPVPDHDDPPQTKRERLPVSEVAFDRPGGPSPFGEDVAFPLPEGQLDYRHE